MTLYSMEWITPDLCAKTVKVGDLIEFRRTMPYCHWAVCVETNGDPSNRTTADVKLVHLQAEIFETAGFGAYLFAHRGRILIQTLHDLHKGHLCRVNNVMDQRYAPLGVMQIVQLAVKKEGMSLYNYTYSNSEHFVNSCRYGRHETLEERVPPLAVLFFFLLVFAIIPTPIALGILTGILVFVLLWLISQKLKREGRAKSSVASVVVDPKTVPQPRTIE
ncbi:Retinoic acid receptor responder protein 3-like isoform X2 [Aphelenchoides besseyi]|nr:Retinoic acid receptor responder protein 3-like isoform X2 [Aphelenchoides besseyi]KAI6210818.1 Retinoic acid receptor responder protein 3-like isoform X2 [Aphelenchoides besseyi]